MALNYSQRPIFPAHTSEDSMVSPLRIVNSEKGGHDELYDRFGSRREIVDKGGSPESVSKDIIDLLPSDPFGMDIDISTTFTAITGWIGDLELDYGDYMRNTFVNHREDYGLFAGFNFFLNSAMKFQSIPTNLMFHDQHYKDFDCVSESVFVTKSEESVNDVATCPDVIGGEPHEAFVLALSYLGTKDLLAVERVCKSLCSTIHNDSLLWRNLYIDQPLNERITDDILVQLTNRADGNLQCLSLIKCPKITDDGLRRVLETNPKLTKLFIPGCTRLSIEGILNNLKAFNSNTETAGIKHIKTGGFYGITLDHYELLNNLLGIQKINYIPHYYHRANSYMPCDDDRAIDVEICPRCQNLRLVYDCPAGGCQPKEQCRACIICIPRCAECGRCVHNSEYEETFSLEYLCSECLKQLPRCQEPRG
ncbi:putative F-box domain, leucine-rich repeat domain superfamily, F-box-like domain superfamily [Helianthus debilis subsp. tardiflorus]